jgi:hypothetical protein
MATRGQRPITAVADSEYGSAEGNASTSVSANRSPGHEIVHRQHAARFQVQLHLCPHRKTPVSGKFHPARPDCRGWGAAQGARIEVKLALGHRLAAIVQQFDVGFGQRPLHGIHQACGIDWYRLAGDADLAIGRLRHGKPGRQAAQFRHAEDPGKSRFRGRRQEGVASRRGERGIVGRQIASLDPIRLRRHRQASGHRK